MLFLGRISAGHQNTLADSVNGGLPAFPGTPVLENTYRQPRNLAINYRYSPTPNLTNELVVGENRFIYSFPNPVFTQALAVPFNPNLSPLPSAATRATIVT